MMWSLSLEVALAAMILLRFTPIMTRRHSTRTMTLLGQLQLATRRPQCLGSVEALAGLNGVLLSTPAPIPRGNVVPYNIFFT